MKKLLTIFLLLWGSYLLLADDVIYSGLYVSGKDVESFQPCKKGKTYWADGSELVMEPIKNFYKEEVKTSEQPIYVMVRGHFHEEESKPPVSDYDGIFHVSEVFLFSSVIPDGCTTQENNASSSEK